MADDALTIRPAEIQDVAGIARVHVDTWRTTYAGIVPDQYLENLSYEKREALWGSVLSQNEAGSHLLVAVRGAEVLGFSSAGRDRDDHQTGELYAIYLRPALHGTGLGRQLFQRSFQIMKKDGFRKIRLWALEDNPTCRFYRAMGGVVSGEKIESFGEKKLKEIAFTWGESEIDTLISGVQA